MKDLKLFQDALMAFFVSLDIQTSLQHIFRLLRQHMPIEGMAFDRFQPGQGLFITRLVTENGYFPIEKIVRTRRVDEEAIYDFERAGTIVIHADSELDPIASGHARILERYLPVRPRGYLVALLSRDDRILGHLALIGSKPDCFREEHRQMMSLLQPVCALAMSTQLEIAQIRSSRERMAVEKHRLEREVFTLIGLGGIVGIQGGMRDVAGSIVHLTDKETPVLLLGETGTGKELIGSIIQKNSRRHDRPFVKINCGAIPESLLDSELFGFDPEGFSGNTMHVGLFEQAHGGTLFLEGVGELPLQAQGRLLRILQDGVVERAGGASITVDVRIIAATNRDLTAMRKMGQFREDLFHRLHVFPVLLPPLRERREDIPLLIKHFSERFARRMGIAEPKIRIESMTRIMSYAWPGNVRELENMVERAMLVDPTGPLDLRAHLPREQAELPLGVESDVALQHLVDSYVAEALERMGSAPAHQKSPAPCGALMTLDEATAVHISEALRACNGKLYGPHGAAQLLGVNYNTLRNKMKKLGLNAKSHRHQLPHHNTADAANAAEPDLPDAAGAPNLPDEL